jgi:hypothetical protein
MMHLWQSSMGVYVHAFESTTNLQGKGTTPTTARCVSHLHFPNLLPLTPSGEPAPGPVEASGKVYVGDYLMRIGQAKVADLISGGEEDQDDGTPVRVVVQQLRESSSRPLVLGFMTREAREALG